MFDIDNKMQIAMAIGNIRNVRLQIGEMSFKEFSEFCSKCQGGGKHESYFIRGVPEFEEEYESRSGQMHGPGYYRHDEPLLSAAFLVIDADDSIATPEQAHDALKHLDYIHFIYTSHSHSKKKNNFRAVIPCEISEKKYMQATARNIISELADAGCPIEFTNEMGTWSQAWFLPTRDNPKDGLFEHYECFEGTPYKQIKIDMKAEKEAGNLTGMDEGNASISDLKRIIMTCAPGMHDALRNLSYQLSKQGMPKATSIMMMQTMMEATPDNARDNRWQEYYNDLPRMCIEPENAEDDEPEELEIVSAGEKVVPAEKVALDWPPGLMGEFARNMHASAPYPNKVMACTAVLGVTAGIAGRRFNINEMGLNLYITYLMRSGQGKNQISQFAKRAMNESILMTGGEHAFMFPNDFTGAKALLDTIFDKRCGLSVQNESGFKRAKKSGDMSGLQGQILNLYTNSGHRATSDSMSYSDSKNNTRVIQAPCLSIIEESTPDLYLDALRTGEQTGQFNRMYLFKCSPDSHKANRNAKFQLSADVSKKLSHLAARCGATQKQDDPDASHFNVLEEMWDFADLCKEEAEDIADENPQKYSMLQRAHEKAWKTACLITLFNRHFKKGQRDGLIVDKEAWAWAVMLHKFEMSGLESFFRRAGEDGIEDIIEKNIIKPICKLLQPKGTTEKPYNSKELSMSRRDIQGNKIPMVIFRRVLKNCRAINDLGRADFGKSGLNVILKYMEDNGYIKVVEKKYILIKKQLFDNFV